MEIRAGALDKRIALKGEIEIEVLNLNFFNSLEPRDKISLWKALDSSIQREADSDQRLQLHGDVFQTFHNFKKMVDHLIFLEQEKEINEMDLPYSLEFRGLVRNEYKLRVLGLKPDPANQTNEEEENGGAEMDETSAGDSESGD